PSLTGMTRAQATSALTAQGLVLSYAGTPDDTLKIVSQNPASGTMVEKGTTVTVVFETPPPPPPPPPTDP
ncbi:MAG: PASTA domain-containing protein, partial [Coriobacteriia bacterium]|nr:PASTA domain-containing protein [Coriobacteriia bacterium]